MTSARLPSSQQLIWLPIAILLSLIGILRAEELPRGDQIARIERAIALGADFLVREQQPDGLWKSKTYGLLKDGTALTPLVLGSLPKSKSTAEARRSGLAVLNSWVDTESRVVRIRMPLESPVYTAGLSVAALRDSAPQDHSVLFAWHDLLRQHQLNARTHWSTKDLEFGGWGYGHDLPLKPNEGERLSPLAEPNLSATVFALEALDCMTDKTNTTLIRTDALKFIEQCQNWAENPAEQDQRYNDGGFHFMRNDDFRNKAGAAGIDSTGQTRFISYGSATADGLRALRRCGLPADHPRVTAARTWLSDHFGNGSHPGDYPADRSHLKPSLDYYYAHSVAVAFHETRPDDPRLADGTWAIVLSTLLTSRQQQDGSWTNPAPDVREDDPLIATSFALRALQLCREQLVLNASRPEAPRSGNPRPDVSR